MRKVLDNFVEVKITLDDINDTAPFLNMSEGLVWYENQQPCVSLAANTRDKQSLPFYLVGEEYSVSMRTKTLSIKTTRFIFIRDELRDKRRNVPICQIRLLVSTQDSQAFKSLNSIMIRVNPDAKSVLYQLRSDQLCRSVMDVDFACVQTCSERHWLRQDDVDQERRLTGLLSLRVLRVMSPVEYIVHGHRPIAGSGGQISTQSLLNGEILLQARVSIYNLK